MKVKFETVIDGINRYIDKEIYSGLNDAQEFVARLAIGRINQNVEGIKQFLMTNGVMRTMGIVDSEGMVDLEQLLGDVKREIERKESLKISVPLIGTLTFKAADVDVLYDIITRG